MARKMGRRITAGRIAINTYREGDGLLVQMGLSSEWLSYEQLQQLRRDLLQVMCELFPEKGESDDE